MDKQSINFINRLTKEADEAGLDAEGWGPVTREDMGSGWKEILGPIHPRYAGTISYGFADATLNIIEGAQKRVAGHYGDEYYIVGVGEAMRPYESLYIGSSPNAAVKAFQKRARQMIDSVQIPPTSLEEST